MTIDEFSTIPTSPLEHPRPNKNVLVRLDGTVVDANLVYSSAGDKRVGVYVELPQLSVKPGNKIVVPLTIINQGVFADQFRVSVDGVPPDWMLTPRSSVVRLMPGEQHDLKLAFQPPHLPSNRAGHYPLQIRVTSQTVPSETVDAKVTLWLTAYSEFKATLTPPRMEAGSSAEVRVQNLGNTQETYTILWDDPLKQLDFAPSLSQIAVPPGDTVIVSFVSVLQRRRWIGGLQANPYTATITAAVPATDTQALTGEVISKAIIPPWILLTTIFACCLFSTLAAFAFSNGDETLQATQTALARLTQTTSYSTLTAASTTDPDGDGLITDEEFQLNTDPQAPDTDGDGLMDGDEVKYGSNPRVVDSDGDTLTDGREVHELRTSPINRDTDGDGLNDNVDPDPLVAASGSPTFIPPTATFTLPPAPTNTTVAPTVTGVPPTNVPVPTATAVTPPPTATSIPPTAIPPTSTPVPPPTATPFVGGLGLIVFETQRDGNNEIYTMNADGTGQTRLTNNTADDIHPQWSPEGSRLVFESKRDGNSEIYTMNADGAGQTRLTNNAADDTLPSWSPFGTRLVFVSTRDGNNEIYVMNADGSSQTRLTNSPGDDLNPQWSPDGSRIAFVSNRDGNPEIYVMNADGTNQVRLTNNSANDCCLAWSPNGARLAFTSDRDGNREIYVMNADGSAQTRLTNNPAPDNLPSWSPDSLRLAFLSNRDGNPEIYVMNANGTSQTRLTNSGGTECCVMWSPEGARLLFATDRDGNFEIYSLLIDPGNGLLQSRLTNNPAYDAPAMWRR